MRALASVARFPKRAAAPVRFPPRFGRIQSLDIARGVAIAGVVIYHFCWDLNLFGFLAVDVTTHPIWVAFARSLAGSFMALVGVSLVLAHSESVRWKAFWRRLLIVATAAAVISIVTYGAFPDSFIYFGILHAIAVSSVLGLAFLRAPLPLVLLAALLLVVVPEYFQSDLLNSRLLAWTGLASWPPSSVDFVPIFPWFTLPLLGIAAARLGLQSSLLTRAAGVRVDSGALRALASAGRQSLVIYLVHQPILLIGLYALRNLVGS